jgi:hypothetical protein
VDFESYLIAKKIDSSAFRKAEPEVWDLWKREFEQIHPDSFTMQKLNLINPIRRKYTLRMTPPQAEQILTSQPTTASPAETEIKSIDPSAPKSKPIMAKPVFKPKPKM